METAMTTASANNAHPAITTQKNSGRRVADVSGKW
jgi:hypothetical protein